MQGGIKARTKRLGKNKKTYKTKGGFNMFSTLKKRIKNEKGLSLVELLAVIVILGIIAAIAVPAIGNIINNQRDKAILSDISGMVSAAKIAVAEGACGIENVCVYDSTANSTTNEIEFKSSKIASGEVDLSSGKSTDPDIKVTYVTNVTFKGSKESQLKTTFAANTAFKESKLNEFMNK